MDKTPRYVIVELYDDAEVDAQKMASMIVCDQRIGLDAKEARPAYFDGFGHFVMVGTPVSGGN